LELTARDVQAETFQMLCQPFDQWRGVFGTRRRDKIGTPSATRIGIERELGDDEQLRVYVERREIEFSRVVFKDAEVCDFGGEKLRGFRVVVVRYANKDDQTAFNGTDDLVLDRDRAVRDALQ
jgi:hypothetical protein